MIAIIAFFVGLFLGGVVGILIAALLVAGNREDEP